MKRKGFEQTYFNSKVWLMSNLKFIGKKPEGKFSEISNKVLANVAWKYLEIRKPKPVIKEHIDYIVDLANYLKVMNNYQSNKKNETDDQKEKRLKKKEERYVRYKSRVKEAEQLSTYKIPSNYQPFGSNKTVKYVEPAKSIPPLTFKLDKVYGEYFFEKINVKSSEFLKTWAWRKLQYQVLEKHGAKCQCCGATAKAGAIINVDHIKPRKLYPELALKFMNLQVLCDDCNSGKGNSDQTDWR